jgi:hypothetical protein
MHDPAFHNFIIFFLVEFTFEQLAYIVLVDGRIPSLEGGF